MTTTLTMLEERIGKVLERLREVDEERSRALEELRELRNRVAEMQEENTTLSAGLSRSERRRRIRRIEGSLREAIAGLRDDAIGG